MLKNTIMNIRFGIKTLRSNDFKNALRDCSKELNKLNLQERKELLSLKYAYKEQKQAYKRSFDYERERVVVSLLTRVVAAYKAEKIMFEMDMADKLANKEELCNRKNALNTVNA